MAQINPHINFNGNAEEAFNFYKSRPLQSKTNPQDVN
jgi:predicted 3-demethylubiquinone-9 3-methyltransferase (glyoxalase superfamily)